MKLFVLNRRRATAAGCVLAAAVMFGAVNYPAVTASATARQLPIYCVERDQKMISISFDAAWGNEDTQQLIDILGKYQVKATFFVVGEWVDKYPESVKALHDAGHEVMNHSNHHDHLSQLSREEIIADCNACNDKIEAVTGVRAGGGGDVRGGELSGGDGLGHGPAAAHLLRGAGSEDDLHLL